MREIILKIRVLFSDIAECITNWNQYVWRANGESYNCCSARGSYGEVDCGCGGVTNYEMWQYQVGDKKQIYENPELLQDNHTQ